MMNVSIKSERGVTAIEYGLIAGAVGLAILTGVSFTGASTKQAFCKVAGAVGGTACPETATYTSNNSYILKGNSLGDLLANMAGVGATSVNGIYDSGGNELTTPSSLLNALGMSQDLYNKFVSDQNEFNTADINQTNAWNAWRSAGYPSSGPLYDAYQNSGGVYNRDMMILQSDNNALYSYTRNTNTTPVYIPNTNNVSFTSGNGSYFSWTAPTGN